MPEEVRLIVIVKPQFDESYLPDGAYDLSRNSGRSSRDGLGHGQARPVPRADHLRPVDSENLAAFR
jgi:hypothetical protein